MVTPTATSAGRTDPDAAHPGLRELLADDAALVAAVETAEMPDRKSVV